MKESKRETKGKLPVRLLPVSVFAIAFGFLEAVVVVYLRELYYPGGFSFPMKLIPHKIYFIEITREVTTIIMLASVGILAGKTRMQKFAYFLIAFALWDIFYYVALKLFLDWPESLLTWDILFLIPIPWLGPVLAPILCSTGMIIYASIILYFEEYGISVKHNARELLLTVTGIVLILATYIWDYASLMIGHGFIRNFFGLMNDRKFLELTSEYVPVFYNWYLFVVGVLLILASMWSLYFRLKRDF